MTQFTTKIVTALLLLIGSLGAPEAMAETLHVAPSGKDDQPGSRAEPLATAAEALKRLRGKPGVRSYSLSRRDVAPT